MATKSRWLKRRGPGARNQESGIRNQESAPAEPESSGEDSDRPAPTSAQPPTPSQGAPTIHKGLYLSALIYVEGDMPAPKDFTPQATVALKEALSKAFEANPGGLSMRVKKVEVQNDVEQDGGEAKSDDDSKEGKFQF